MSLNKLKNNKLVQKIRGEFSRDVVISGTVKLASGNLIGQVINFISSPILARLFSDNVFGIYSLFVSILFISGTVMMGQYEQAIPIENDFSGTKSIVRLCHHISFLFIPFLIIGSYLYVNSQTIYEQQIDLIGFVIAITITGYVQTIANRQAKLLIKYKKYKDQSISQIFYTASYVISALLIKLVSETVNALIYAYCISEIVTCAIRTISVNRIKNWHSSYKNREKEMAEKYINFPKYNVLSTFLNSLSTNMPSFVIQSLFGTAAVGIYGMANKIVGIPFSVISTSVTSVFYQEASNRFHSSSGDLKEIGDLSFRKLALLSSVPMTALLVLGDILFKIVLGEQWEESGKICQMLAIWMSIVFVVSPMISIYSIKQKQKITVGINIALLVFRTAALLLGGKLSNNFSLAMLLFSLVGAVVWCVIYCMVSKEMRLSLKENTLYYLKIYVPCALVMLGIRYFTLLIF